MESRITFDENETKRWVNEEGQFHRDDGPAVIWPDGTKIWFQNDKKHRDNGPAVIWADGTEEWFLNGQLHRENGPALMWENGTKIWCQNGFAHREDGPAVICANGSVEWWLNDKKYSFQEWADKLNLDQKTKLEMIMKWNPD